MYSAFPGERPSRFYLVREEADLSLDPNTGMLRIRQPLDRESRDKYVLSIEARNGGSIGYCQVKLHILQIIIVSVLTRHNHSRLSVFSVFILNAHVIMPSVRKICYDFCISIKYYYIFDIRCNTCLASHLKTMINLPLLILY